MSEWQPIETAPKDGTWIIALHDDGCCVSEASWSIGNRWGAECWHPRYYEQDGSSTLYPTHWMTLEQP